MREHQQRQDAELNSRYPVPSDADDADLHEARLRMREQLRRGLDPYHPEDVPAIPLALYRQRVTYAKNQYGDPRYKMIGEGAESAVYADETAGTVYKFAHIRRGGIGDAITLAHVMNAIGATPTELVGMDEENSNRTLIKQPLANLKNGEERPDDYGDRFSNLVRMPAPFSGHFFARIDGENFFLSDLRLSNSMPDNAGNERIIDAQVHTAEEMAPNFRRAPEILDWIAEQEAKGDTARGGALFSAASPTPVPPPPPASIYSAPS
ncbi:MAG: hypothetical protein LBR07_01885, partial [Puniceicoccales bacterium]|nr:hypothetical protein [Puniceicoccales bacterium]